MKETRFHRAAREGHLDAIKEANRNDCNTPDEDGMTPTLLAAARGNLDALRLLVGRGGDPDKSDYTGNSALHWAAQNGHINCVYFLVNFGANIWALDNFNLTAREVAAIKGQQEILRVLDAEDHKQTLKNKKKAQAMKDKAKKEAEKRIKKLEKMQKQAEKEAMKTLKSREKPKGTSSADGSSFEDQAPIARPSISIPNEDLRRDSRLIYPSTFSELTSSKVLSPAGKTPMSAVAQRIYKKKEITATQSNEFKIREIDDDGNHTVRSIDGIRKGSDVIYVPKFQDQQSNYRPGNKKHAGDIFNLEVDDDNGSTSKSSQLARYLDGDLLHLNVEPGGIFERPGFGNMAFRRSSLTSLTDGIMSIPTDYRNHNGNRYSDDDEYDDDDSAHGSDGRSAGGSVGNRSGKHATSGRPVWPAYAKTPSVTDSALETFLIAHDLHSCLPYLRHEQVDLNALFLLSDDDLKDIGIPMGQRKKMMEAIQYRMTALKKAGTVQDSRL